jgi:hypothetical protein
LIELPWIQFQKKSQVEVAKHLPLEQFKRLEVLEGLAVACPLGVIMALEEQLRRQLEVVEERAVVEAAAAVVAVVMAPLAEINLGTRPAQEAQEFQIQQPEAQSRMELEDRVEQEALLPQVPQVQQTLVMVL